MVGGEEFFGIWVSRKGEGGFEEDKGGNKGKWYWKNRGIIEMGKEDVWQEGNMAETGDFGVIKRVWNFVCVGFGVDEFEDK